MFTLCYKCAEKENQKECKCPISDRAFISTYCTPEVEVAINMGYIIEEIYEVLHWPDTSLHEYIFETQTTIKWLSFKHKVVKRKRTST